MEPVLGINDTEIISQNMRPATAPNNTWQPSRHFGFVYFLFPSVLFRKTAAGTTEAVLLLTLLRS